ncbi:unnamed protein product, partial [Prunus brigantina]
SLTPLEVRLAGAKKARESSTRVKGSYVIPGSNPEVGKFNPVGDAGMSNLLKTNFLSCSSTCAELVNHIHQAGNLDTFSSFSLEKQREATFHLLKVRLVFATETIRNSSVVAHSFGQLSELENKNDELAIKLSAQQTYYEKKTFDLRAMISELKSSLIEKDFELSYFAADLVSRKDAYFRLECKNADMSLSYDKLLARLRPYHKSIEKSKSEAIIDAYKLGYLHSANGTAPFYAIEDGDIETFCLDFFHVQSAQGNAVNM